ncbi:MAG TPA: 4'-phosphopantetheinyl transferase superfamily protein [Pyrinomonadaceae bacterium]|nr:4'-phosphopantetheinyl transferase superfamily protein [Pyrinomonadaceae bacterium]
MPPEETTTWTEPPQSPSLEAHTVHVWRISLDQPDDRLARFRRTLEPDELNRASRFHFEKHQRHFIVARGFLRSVVARYLETRPEALQFSYGAYGKPGLASEHVLRFNLSHSHEVALLAVALDAELGVDVEHIRADFASEEIARRFFSRAEVEVFNALPKEEQVEAFFRCWTRKEAYIKAIGKGLSQALDAFDVTLAPDVQPALLRVEGDDASRWLLRNVDVGEGYAGALAVERPVAEVRSFRQDLQD